MEYGDTDIQFQFRYRNRCFRWKRAWMKRGEGRCPACSRPGCWSYVPRSRNTAGYPEFTVHVSNPGRLCVSSAGRSGLCPYRNRLLRSNHCQTEGQHCYHPCDDGQHTTELSVFHSIPPESCGGLDHGGAKAHEGHEARRSRKTHRQRAPSCSRHPRLSPPTVRRDTCAGQTNLWPARHRESSSSWRCRCFHRMYRPRRA